MTNVEEVTPKFLVQDAEKPRVTTLGFASVLCNLFSKANLNILLTDESSLPL